MPQTDPNVTKAVHAIDQEFAQFFNARQWDRIVQNYAEDARFLAPNAPEVVGRPGIRGLVEQMSQVFSDVRVEPGPVLVSGDLAVSTGKYQAKLKTPQGTVDDRGKYVEAFRREPNGSWKVIVDSFSSDLQPPA